VADDESGNQHATGTVTPNSSIGKERALYNAIGMEGGVVVVVWEDDSNDDFAKSILVVLEEKPWLLEAPKAVKA
jgi:hypothetical protein